MKNCIMFLPSFTRKLNIKRIELNRCFEICVADPKAVSFGSELQKKLPLYKELQHGIHEVNIEMGVDSLYCFHKQMY